MRRLPLLSCILLFVSGCAFHVHYHQGEQHYEVPKDSVMVKHEKPEGASDTKSDVDQLIDSLNERPR